jgi:hypothetical protein
VKQLKWYWLPSSQKSSYWHKSGRTLRLSIVHIDFSLLRSFSSAKYPVESFLTQFDSTFSRPEIAEWLIFLSLISLLMWDFEWQCHRAFSHLVIYRKWGAPELEKLEMKNAIIKDVLLHKSIPRKELIWTCLIKI